MSAAHEASQGLAAALADIRQKVVEEPWFGRAVTPQLVRAVDGESLAEALGWALADDRQGRAQVHDRQAPQPGQHPEIDR